MTYVQINNDGTASELGAITGYQVVYQQGKKQMRSQRFGALWQALGFQKTMRMGQNSTIVPIYQQTTIPAAS